jgi:hypothetical protein
MPDSQGPKIGSPEDAHTAKEIRSAEGKTIRTIEFGSVVDHPFPERVHQSEAIILHFNDGTALTLWVGSNAWNLAQEFKGLLPGDFHTNLIPEWNRD